MHTELTKLGYTEKWIRFGLLDQDILTKQIISFQNGDDSNTEHFRYQTFINWLETKADVNDVEIQNFVELAVEDKDQLMAGSAIVQLLRHPEITDNQFKFISEKLSTFGSWTKKVIEREQLKRKSQHE
ncbi:hypothetical protein [Kordia sp.]|uniref:hypothetical protein n=1 Tax=Kordia sp. TaxID=1965332 RepID=UPI003B58F966